jgi:hypothetical protein
MNDTREIITLIRQLGVTNYNIRQIAADIRVVVWRTPSGEEFQTGSLNVLRDQLFILIGRGALTFRD